MNNLLFNDIQIIILSLYLGLEHIMVSSVDTMVYVAIHIR